MIVLYSSVLSRLHQSLLGKYSSFQNSSPPPFPSLHPDESGCMGTLAHYIIFWFNFIALGEEPQVHLLFLDPCLDVHIHPCHCCVYHHSVAAAARGLSSQYWECTVVPSPLAFLCGSAWKSLLWISVRPQLTSSVGSHPPCADNPSELASSPGYVLSHLLEAERNSRYVSSIPGLLSAYTCDTISTLL